MTNEEKMREAFELVYFQAHQSRKRVAGVDGYCDGYHEIWEGFQAAYQSQQTKIDGLMQNIESTNQTNAALIKKLDIAIEALEVLLEDTQHKNHDCGGTARDCPVVYARKALSQLKDMK